MTDWGAHERGSLVLADYYDAFGAYRGSTFWFTPAPEYGFNGQQYDASACPSVRGT